MVAMTMFVAFSSCKKDEEEVDYSSTTVLAGDYVGTAKWVGYSDEPSRAYATVVRRSSDVVSFQLYCEPLGLDLSPINLVVEQRNGIIYLTSESDLAVDGTVSAGIMSVTCDLTSGTIVFNGKKD